MDKDEVAKNATLESVGVGAMAAGIALVSSGRYLEGIAVVAIGVGCFVLKYARRKWNF